jgi:hypothetical protein
MSESTAPESFKKFPIAIPFLVRSKPCRDAKVSLPETVREFRHWAVITPFMRLCEKVLDGFSSGEHLQAKAQIKNLTYQRIAAFNLVSSDVQGFTEDRPGFRVGIHIETCSENEGWHPAQLSPVGWMPWKVFYEGLFPMERARVPAANRSQTDFPAPTDLVFLARRRYLLLSAQTAI